VSLSRLPQLGSVVWVELADANGFRKVRPTVVVSATADIAAGKPVRVVAITTLFPTPLPADHVYCLGTDKGKRVRACGGSVRRLLRGWRKSRSAMSKRLLVSCPLQ